MPRASSAPDSDFERQFHRQGYTHVAGLDEVGRGCLAGPVAAGAVILPPRPSADLYSVVRDSKQLSSSQLAAAYEQIVQGAVTYAVGWTTPAEIDRIGISPSVRRAMHRALLRLDPSADALLIDALTLRSTNLPQRSIVRGDSKSLSIGAASIVAKVQRDRLMFKLAETHPGYGFGQHKGYGTERHMAAIRELGPSPEHRMSFSPLNRSKLRHQPAANTTDTGMRAESFAAAAIEDRGMRILDRNFRTRTGEVDLVAADGETLVFIEVRARRSSAFATPAESISSSKAMRLISACEEYLQTTSNRWTDWRIDFAAVELDSWNRPAAAEFIESAIEDVD